MLNNRTIAITEEEIIKCLFYCAVCTYSNTARSVPQKEASRLTRLSSGSDLSRGNNTNVCKERESRCSALKFSSLSPSEVLFLLQYNADRTPSVSRLALDRGSCMLDDKHKHTYAAYFTLACAQCV